MRPARAQVPRRSVAPRTSVHERSRPGGAASSAHPHLAHLDPHRELPAEGRPEMKTAPFPRPLALLLAAAATGPLAAAGILGSAPAQEEPAVRYGRVGEAAVVRNLADERGTEIARPASGSLVSIHGETAGWLEVEVPGGFPVWVHGRYLQPSAEADVYEVTRNAVNMRPRPQSEVTNFPLPQRLHAGDRVRGIELFQAEQPLDANWVRIWSPPGVRAYLRAEAAVPLAPGEDGAALWAAALETLSASGARPAPRQKEAVPASSPAERGRDAEAREELERARTILAQAGGDDDVDLAPARRALEAALRLAPEGPVAVETRLELDRLAFHEEAARVRAELTQERERLAAEAQRRQAEVEDRSRAKDPLGGVYVSRGLLVRQVATDGTPRYFLRFGGEVASELLCPDGRYELDDFAGYEVGVFGAELEAERTAERGGFPLIGIERLEVVARR